MSMLKKIIVLSTCTFGVIACSTSQKELLPTDGETMLDVWKQGGGSQSALIEARNALQFVRPIESPAAQSAEFDHYTRTAENEAKNLFPRLPNPDLAMFVFPHLSNTAEPVPIPGYTTVFPFYGRVQYAQPGERTRDY
ncbi:TIGR03751 family conjugal transfer lipoprotein [Avibacterium endocarditidis]|uniref:TIGR03751 family conjugal transfer lipoprotein n=1 Tax=Avibacterium endocarditidis TaxID=380674 RepID=A0ABX4ZUJ2_9PAST|nr:TIGR03751 family conjugal transfer lipoprotein [Avibacterium endocarditidis]POY43184.1 TIGR03751 family conjugal transfer lipoprotein [Avibacterium endocarditidis]